MSFTIGVDVDDTVGSLLKVWLFRYNRDYNDNLKPSSIKEWNLIPYVKKECGKKIYDYIQDPSMYDDVYPIALADAGISCLRALGHRVVFITSSTEGHAGRKYKWLKEWGLIDSRENYIEAEDKSLICVDYLVDDRPLNVEKTRGIGLLFSSPHNEYFKWENRLNDWEEVMQYFIKATNKQILYG